MTRGNCLLFALRRWRQLQREWRAAGRPCDRVPCIVQRPSRLVPHWVPHWVVGWWHPHTATVHDAESFVPEDKTPLPWWQVWRALWFAGRVQRGDQP